MTLLIAYGNPGRGDDGLGPALAERLEADLPNGLRVVVDYQLTVEHALLLTEVSTVVFADAELASTAPYTFSREVASTGGDVSSHSLAPRTVLNLAGALYAAKPEAFVLGIRGYEFGEVREGLSHGALENLTLTEGFFRDWLKQSDAVRRRSGDAIKAAQQC